ncbi:LysM peptidoglycan-binding domain-containing protein [Thiocystis violacea]|uniref:LysM peptidoglycan-binding domain-containing protein n=1 Tax=Thiocystis violacea TaxID=13725 RepID=UPI0019059E58|nr:LysM peptidoglycan-binding domain-containing protein [Thiocystis violacea]
MRHHRSGHGSSRVALVAPWPLLILLLAAIPAEKLRAVEPAVPTGTATPTMETLDQLHRQIDELRQRVQGMEGKLRDSAAARKGADQARMEAERRLAEGSQEIDQLREQLRARQDTQGELEQRLSEREDVIARLAAERQSLQATNETLGTRVEALQRQLPKAEGGTLTADEARRSAAEAVAAFRAVRRDSEGTQSPAVARSLREAEAQLHRSQFRLASVLAARSLYRVRANDSLALISNRFYGSSAQWRNIFEANRHLLDDPDQLAPGMTLVIP